MSRAADRLARALCSAAQAAGVTATLGPLASRPWRSALFSGETHTAELVGADDAATTAWLATLPAIELPVPGHVTDVAVAAVSRQGGRLAATLHLQTIEA